jgi:hypothetical protein
MNTNDGKFLEQLVQIIEKSISPDSIVEHNVQLPILNSKSGLTAQCDIVIRTGKKPRQTITIVEVQDRNRATDINDFRGWKQKLEDVGAQHLFCVSRKEFPKSIKEMAALSGNTIKLITIKELEAKEIPLTLLNFSGNFYDIDIVHIKRDETRFFDFEAVELGITQDKVEEELKVLMANDFKFSFDKKELIALSTLCLENSSTTEDVVLRTSVLDLGYDKKMPFFFLTSAGFISIRLRIKYTWTNKVIPLPISVLSYEQNEYGALAWVVESFYQSSRGPIWIKIPVTKNDDDSYSISGMLLSLPETLKFSFKLEKSNDKK